MAEGQKTHIDYAPAIIYSRAMCKHNIMLTRLRQTKYNTLSSRKYAVAIYSYNTVVCSIIVAALLHYKGGIIIKHHSSQGCRLFLLRYLQYRHTQSLNKKKGLIGE